MNCDGKCNGKCHLLGVLEQKIMESLWASPVPLKPAEVQSNILGDYAYTTIMTVLKRMADKKILNRRAEGHVYYYSPVLSKKDFSKSCLDDLFERLFCSYGDSVVDSFNSVSKKFQIKL